MRRNHPTIRRHLDARFARLPETTAFVRPPVGWIRAIRHALGMSASDLAARMGVTKARILAIERSEVTGTLKLDTLRRVAEALECTLVYTLVPDRPLEVRVKEQALRVAGEHLSAVDHTMRLEDQGISQQASQQQLRELAEDLARRSPRSLWKRRPTR